MYCHWGLVNWQGKPEPGKWKPVPVADLAGIRIYEPENIHIILCQVGVADPFSGLCSNGRHPPDRVRIIFWYRLHITY